MLLGANVHVTFPLKIYVYLLMSAAVEQVVFPNGERHTDIHSCNMVNP